MNKRERFAEKRDVVLHWLLEFQFSTAKILSRALGLERANQNRFFLSLKKSGLVATTKSPFIYEQIYFLSGKGKEFAHMLSEKAERYVMTATKILASTTIHHLSVQCAVLTRSTLTLRFDCQSEWHLDMPVSKRPDAIVSRGARMEALEVELTQKTVPRIYLGFLTHLDNIKQHHYDTVEYIFSDEALMQRYQQRFDASVWPLYTANRYGKITPVHDHQGIPTTAQADLPQIRERFRFTHERLYR